MLNLFNFIKNLSRLWVIITLILQNQLTFCTGFWGSRTWKLDNIKLVQEVVEDTKGVIRIRISKKNRQHNVQEKKYKVQITIYKTYT
jgi:hypothetical protein